MQYILPQFTHLDSQGMHKVDDETFPLVNMINVDHLLLPLLGLIILQSLYTLTLYQVWNFLKPIHL